MYAGKTVGVMHVTQLTRSPKTRCEDKGTGQNCSVAMSALPPKADILRGGSDVRFVPKADIAMKFSAV